MASGLEKTVPRNLRVLWLSGNPVFGVGETGKMGDGQAADDLAHRLSRALPGLQELRIRGDNLGRCVRDRKL